MKGWMLLTLGAVCVLIGGTWFLQGIGVIGGSFMSSSTTWLIIGLVVAVVGVVLAIAGARASRRATGRPR
jgi:hypothetical protein